MQLAGMAPAKSFDTTVGLMGLMVVGNMCGWVFVEWFGRRGTALYGTAILSATLYMIGILACIKRNGAIWGQVVFMAIWSFSMSQLSHGLPILWSMTNFLSLVYQGTVGSVAWAISAETPTSRLRAPTQSLGTMMNGLSSCIWSFALPYAINPDQGNLGGKIAFVFGSVLVFAAVWIYFFIPESKGRTYIELDELWAQGIPPRKFNKTKLVTVATDEKL